jgi:hypothetical protein
LEVIYLWRTYLFANHPRLPRLRLLHSRTAESAGGVLAHHLYVRFSVTPAAFHPCGSAGSCRCCLSSLASSRARPGVVADVGGATMGGRGQGRAWGREEASGPAAVPGAERMDPRRRTGLGGGRRREDRRRFPGRRGWIPGGGRWPSLPVPRGERQGLAEPGGPKPERRR